MKNNKLMAVFFSGALALGMSTQGCMFKDLKNYYIERDTLTAFDLYQNSGNNDNLKQVVIDVKIDEIIDELDLYQTDNPALQLDMCLKVQKYMTINNCYDDKMTEEKRGDSFRETYFNDLYNVLVNRQGICTSNSAEFKEILSRVGIDVKCVFVTPGGKKSHMCNIVNLGGKYYYFDTTLEKTIYNSEIYDKNNVVLFCAGLGTDNYEKSYRPIGIMDDNFGEEILPMPRNMAKSDIPLRVINADSLDALAKFKK